MFFQVYGRNSTLMFALDDVLFQSNEVQGFGGGLYFETTGHFTLIGIQMESTSFISNHAVGMVRGGFGAGATFILSPETGLP